MPKYIEREALLKDISESVVFTVRGNRPSLEIRGANKVIDRIKSAPTADVVEVVRCKDCKYGDFYCSSILCGNAHAPWYNDEFDATMELDDYCSYGERKEGAENGIV